MMNEERTILRWALLGAIFLITLLASHRTTQAQDSDAPSVQIEDPVSTADPTVPGESLRQALGAINPVNASAAVEIPRIRLKARVIVEGKLPSALIEINDELHVVEEGTRLTVAPSGRATTRVTRRSGRRSSTSGLTNRTGTVRAPTLDLEVIVLTEKELQIEISPLNETIIVH